MEEEQIETKVGELPLEEEITFSEQVEEVAESPEEIAQTKPERDESILFKKPQEQKTEDETGKTIIDISKNDPDAPKKFNYSKVGFIINPAAGKGRCGKDFSSKIYPFVKKLFINGECCFYETKRHGDGNRLAKKYLSQGYDYLISVGGDGTNNEIINGIMEYSIENENVQKFIIGFIPFGSGCDWERTFGLTSDSIEKVVYCLSNAYTIPCDIGEVEAIEFDSDNKIKKYFLNGLQ